VGNKTSGDVITLQLTLEEINVLRSALDTHEEGLIATSDVATEDPTFNTVTTLLDATGSFAEDRALIRGIREKVNNEHPDGAFLRSP
jgi:hypothetical protein